MRASINGEQLDLPEGLSVGALLEHLKVPSKGIAVARNDRVVRRSAFAQEAIEDGDRVEIIKAVAGG